MVRKCIDVLLDNEQYFLLYWNFINFVYVDRVYVLLVYLLSFGFGIKEEIRNGNCAA